LKGEESFFVSSEFSTRKLLGVDAYQQLVEKGVKEKDAMKWEKVLPSG